MSLDRETLTQFLETLDRFVRERLIPNEARIAEDDAIPEVQTSTSLLVIAVVLAITTAASLLKSRRDPQARAHAGSLRDTSDERRQRVRRTDGAGR